jgi:hypothetical protein
VVKGRLRLRATWSKKLSRSELSASKLPADTQRNSARPSNYMTDENAVPNQWPQGGPARTIPRHERTAVLTDGLEVRTSKSRPAYRIVRAGRGWPELRQGADTETDPAAGRWCRLRVHPEGGGEGSPRSSRES